MAPRLMPFRYAVCATLTKTIIRKVKRPDGIGRWPAFVVDTDRFGVWLFSPQGTIYRGRTGSSITECEVGQGHRAAGRPVLHLISDAAWWIAAWCFDGDQPVISADICTPPTLIDGEWHYVDLELDPHLFADGRVEVLDEEEFRAACKAGLIAQTEAVEARKAAQELEQRLRDRVEPFGTIGWQRFSDAAALMLQPITVLDDEVQPET